LIDDVARSGLGYPVRSFRWLRSSEQRVSIAIAANLRRAVRPLPLPNSPL